MGAVDASPASVLIGPKLAVTLIGGLIAIVSIFLWALEGNEGYHLHPEEDGAEHGHGAQPSPGHPH